MNENIEILQRQFGAYCTKVLKYASISYYHANRRRTEHEVEVVEEKDCSDNIIRHIRGLGLISSDSEKAKT